MAASSACPTSLSGSMTTTSKVASMDSFTATGIAEGWIECESEEQYIGAWQSLVDSGLAWRLQGWFGRTAERMIEEGLISPKGDA